MSGSAVVTATDFAGHAASVRLGPVAQELLDELPDLYGSLFATAAWFTAYDCKTPEGVCVLDGPRHVLAFCVEGDTVEVLNKAFPMAPRDARRACLALFHALPHVRRIHLEVLFPPHELRAPKRVLAAAEDLVVQFPLEAADYPTTLGRRTRKNLRNFENRLRREHPNVVTSILAPSQKEAAALTEQLVAWNVARLHDRGILSGFEKHPERRDKLRELLALGDAEAHVTSLAGRPAAIEFVFYVGDEATVFAGAFDDAYAGVHLGFLSTYWAVRETARRGARRCHLLWTTSSYKERLGAEPQTATQLSLFRTPAARLWSLGEARHVHWRDFRKAARRRYWDARHAGRRAVERATGRSRGGGEADT